MSVFVFKPAGLHNCVLMRLWWISAVKGVSVCVCVCVRVCVSTLNRYLALGDAHHYYFVSYVLFIKNKQAIHSVTHFCKKIK